MRIIGEEGTGQNSELKPGVYQADPKEKYMKVDLLSIAIFADGEKMILDDNEKGPGLGLPGRLFHWVSNVITL